MSKSKKEKELLELQKYIVSKNKELQLREAKVILGEDFIKKTYKTCKDISKRTHHNKKDQTWNYGITMPFYMTVVFGYLILYISFLFLDGISAEAKSLFYYITLIVVMLVYERVILKLTSKHNNYVIENGDYKIKK